MHQIAPIRLPSVRSMMSIQYKAGAIMTLFML